MRALVLLSLVAACGSVRADDPMESVDAGVPPPADIDAPPAGAFPLTLSTTSVDFAGIALAQRSVSISVLVTNTGTAPTAPLDTTLAGDAADFMVADGCTGVTLDRDASCRIDVTFIPTMAGTRVATFVVRIDGFDDRGTVSLTGRGLTGSLVITPPLHDFAPQDLGVASTPVALEIVNNGEVTSDALASRLPPSSPFAIVDDTCSGTRLEVGGRCTVRVTFTPSALGAATVTSLEVDGGVSGATAASLGGRGRALTSVAFGGLGAGVVTSTPAGIDCGATCSAYFESAPVILTATPAAGNAFMRWTGACTGPTCTLPLASASSTVTAVFEPLRTLTVNPGWGSVTVDPIGETCVAESCAYQFPRTTSVRVTPNVPDGYVFVRWFGATVCANRVTCTFSLGSDTTLTAVMCPADDACCLSPGSPACQG